MDNTNVPPGPVLQLPSPPRRRWLVPLAGGLIIPFDPMLGVALVVVGLWSARRRPRARPVRP
jgi:hypothetical protein